MVHFDVTCLCLDSSAVHQISILMTAVCSVHFFILRICLYMDVSFLLSLVEAIG